LKNHCDPWFEPANLDFGSTLIDDVPLPLNDLSLKIFDDQFDEDFDLDFKPAEFQDVDEDNFAALYVKPQVRADGRELAKFESVTYPAIGLLNTPPVTAEQQTPSTEAEKPELLISPQHSEDELAEAVTQPNSAKKPKPVPRVTP
jgi:hypothetical protein